MPRSSSMIRLVDPVEEGTIVSDADGRGHFQQQLFQTCSMPPRCRRWIGRLVQQQQIGLQGEG